MGWKNVLEMQPATWSQWSEVNHYKAHNKSSDFFYSLQLAQKLVETQESKGDTGLALKEILEDCLAPHYLNLKWNPFLVTLALVL